MSSPTLHRDRRLLRGLTPSGPVSVGILVAGFILLLIAWHRAHVHDPPPVSRIPLPVPQTQAPLEKIST